MTELVQSDINYRITKNNDGIIIECDKPMHLEDKIIDTENDCFILAVKTDVNNHKYYVDYVYLNQELNIIRVLREDRGVLPKFIIAPDNRIWVRLSSTQTEKNGEIVLPLEKRCNVTKEIIKRDIGFWDYFRLGNKFYGFEYDVFNLKKPAQLGIYEFGKNNQYKNRKMKKLEGIHYGNICVLQGHCYITASQSTDEGERILVYEADGEANILNVWSPKISIEKANGFCLMLLDEIQYKFLFVCGNDIETAMFDIEGNLIQREKIFEGDKKIYTADFTVAKDFAAVFFVNEGGENNLFVTDSNEKKLYKAETDMTVCILNKEYMIESGTGMKGTYIKIIRTGLR